MVKGALSQVPTQNGKLKSRACPLQKAPCGVSRASSCASVEAWAKKGRKAVQGSEQMAGLVSPKLKAELAARCAAARAEIGVGLMSTGSCAWVTRCATAGGTLSDIGKHHGHGCRLLRMRGYGTSSACSCRQRVRSISLNFSPLARSADRELRTGIHIHMDHHWQGCLLVLAVKMLGEALH